GYCRYADAVAVAADAGDDAAQQSAVVRSSQFAESERIEQPDRACTDGDDVTDNAADTRRGSLIRFDCRGMIMGLHFEDHRLVVTNGHTTRTFSRSLQHAYPASGGLLVESF